MRSRLSVRLAVCLLVVGAITPGLAQAASPAASGTLTFAVGRHGSVHIMPTRAGAAQLAARAQMAGVVPFAFPHNFLPYNGGLVVPPAKPYHPFRLAMGVTIACVAC